jgi:hypothetical protein
MKQLSLAVTLTAPNHIKEFKSLTLSLLSKNKPLEYGNTFKLLYVKETWKVLCVIKKVGDGMWWEVLNHMLDIDVNL